MAKAKSDENDDAAEQDRDSKRSDENDASGSDSSSELEPVRPKKGEPPDNLHRRSEWFQKRHG